jgi:beta-glucanase (GH16 family)
MCALIAPLNPFQHERDQTKKKIVDMEIFLNDYGLVWVGPSMDKKGEHEKDDYSNHTLINNNFGHNNNENNNNNHNLKNNSVKLPQLRGADIRNSENYRDGEMRTSEKSREVESHTSSSNTQNR